MSKKPKVAQVIEVIAIVAAFFDVGLFVTEHFNRVYFTTVMAATASALAIVLYFNPASHLRRIYSRVRRLFLREPHIKWFVEREDARPDMTKEWRNHSWAVFVGLSQRSLKTYLNDELAKGETFPWKAVDIYFASNAIGSAFEGESFLPNVCRSRQEIAAELTSPTRRNQLPFLETVNFLQYDAIVGYSGSLFGSFDDKVINAIYIVEALPVRRGEAKQALTFKIAADGTETWNPSHKAVLTHYRNGHLTIAKSSRSMGTLHRSVWDMSAADWARFCDESQVMRSEMRGLIKFAGPLKGLTVLDIGCGSGEMSRELIDADVAHLTALDSSPQMLECAKGRIGEAPNVRFALCRVPSHDKEAIDLGGLRYDVIICHQSLPAMAPRIDDLEALARWCVNYLKDGGRFILAAHNTVVRLDSSAWIDPFRENMKAFASNDPVFKDSLRESRNVFEPADLDINFTKAGFVKVHFATQKFPIMMEERELMWRVPAILDSFVNVQKVGFVNAIQLVDKAGERVRGVATLERTVGYWSFAKASHRQP